MNTQPTQSVVAQYAVTTLLTLTVAALITGVALLLISKIGITGSALFGSGAVTLVLALGIWSCYMISKSADGLQRPVPTRLNNVPVGDFQQRLIAANARLQELESQLNSLQGNQHEETNLSTLVSLIIQHKDQIMQLETDLIKERDLNNELITQRDAQQRDLTEARDQMINLKNQTNEQLTNMQMELRLAREDSLRLIDSLQQEITRLRSASPSATRYHNSSPVLIVAHPGPPPPPDRGANLNDVNLQL